MFLTVDQSFDLISTLQSGQTFRWKRDGDWFEGIVFNNIVRIRQDENTIEFTSTPDDEVLVRPLLTDYLAIGVDLEQIYSSIGVDDRIISAISRYRGMRILRQDPWECLVSFICSSASNIPRISSNVESICTAFGREIGFGDSFRKTFPTPQELAGVDEYAIRQCGVGCSHLMCLHTELTVFSRGHEQSLPSAHRLRVDFLLVMTFLFSPVS